MRAGSPPTSAAILIRHAESGALHQVDTLLAGWETWSSELLESHLSYPMLVYYRSQHDNQSWLAALAAVLDCCGLILVGLPEIPALQARMTFTMARQVLIEMGRSLGVVPSRYTGGDRMDGAAYDRMVAALEESGVRWRAGDTGRDMLFALRATYEPLLDGLAGLLMISLPGFMPAAGASDHWQSGPRGLIAGRLVEQLAERSGVGPVRQGRLSGRLLAQLKSHR